jgi:hypothetical protein
MRIAVCAQPVARKIERVDLDSRVLPDFYEANVSVRDHCLDLEPRLNRNDGHERLRGRHHATDRVGGELLHHAFDRSRPFLQTGALLCLMMSCASPSDLNFDQFERNLARAAQLGPEPLAADGPGFPVTIHQKIGKGGAGGGVKQTAGRVSGCDALHAPAEAGDDGPLQRQH